MTVPRLEELNIGVEGVVVGGDEVIVVVVVGIRDAISEMFGINAVERELVNGVVYSESVDGDDDTKSAANDDGPIGFGSS